MSTRGVALAGTLIAAAVALVAVAALASGMLTGHRSSAREGAAAARPRTIGPDRIEAASRYPLRCLRVTSAVDDPDYARAELDRASACRRDSAWVTAILHHVDGGWRPVLVGTAYTCPVRSLPAAVQAELAVCPRPAAPDLAAGSTGNQRQRSRVVVNDWDLPREGSG
ncbi:MAG: hypothetical protein JOY58_08990 [Solirubrobacterales bacterium]|nr:hypothetical protein [Solirubrobacterales bacterium]